MFDMKLKISILGIIIFMLPMLINIIYCIYPPANEMQKTTVIPKKLELVEQGTRILYAIAIVFWVSNQKIDRNSFWLYMGILFLILYYIVWIRYFAHGRDIVYLGKNFLFIPMPLAVFPVLYYLCATLWVHNYFALIFMAIFGIAHNIISYLSLYK